MEPRSYIFFVASDQSRNGKSTLTRLLADFLALQGSRPFVADLDEPTGGVCEFLPDNSEVFDITRIGGQVELFDWILANPERDYLIDIPARHLHQVFSAVDDIGFVAGAREAGFDVAVFYIVEGVARSLEQAKFIKSNIDMDWFIAVRHSVMDNALKDFEVLSTYNDLAVDGRIVLPLLSDTVRRAIDAPPFSFRAFIEGSDVSLSPAGQLELATFLEPVVDSLQKLKRRLDIGNLHSLR